MNCPDQVVSVTPRQRSAGTSSPIRDVKRRLVRQRLHESSVVGVGIEAAEYGGEWLKVYLAEVQPALRALMPPEIDGYAVTIEVVGRIRTQVGSLAGSRDALA